MRVLAESTERIVQVDGVECRVWKATSEGGVPCFLLVHRVMVREDLPQNAFKGDLLERVAPAADHLARAARECES